MDSLNVWLRCASVGVVALLLVLVGLAPLSALAQSVTWEPWELVGESPQSITAGSFLFELAICPAGVAPESGSCAYREFGRPAPSDEECSRLNLFDEADLPGDQCHYRAGSEEPPEPASSINWADPAQVLQVLLWFFGFGLFVHGYATGSKDV